RNVVEWEATDEDRENAVKVIERQKKSGKGSFRLYVVVNSEPYELVNTFQKMAQKRAFIAATLLATNASEFFSQDLEDIGYIEGEYRASSTDDDHAHPQTAAPTPAPAPARVSAPAARNGASSNGASSNGHKDNGHDDRLAEHLAEQRAEQERLTGMV